VLRPEAAAGGPLPLDAPGEHLWWPVAPLARIEVDLAEPALRFAGTGYHDANAGAGPLEQTFHRWSWARARTERRALVTYDVVERGGATRALGIEVDERSSATPLRGLAPAPLPATAWGLERRVLADRGQPARVVRGLEDGPFYARSLVEARLGGRGVVAVHEQLDADRLTRGWVRFLTRFRMRRAA